MPEDGRGDINLIALATDADGNSVSIVTVTQPEHGVVSLQDGIAAYIPVPNYNGQDSFTFVVTDGMAESIGRISIVVTPTNDDPVVELPTETQFVNVGEEFTYSIEATDIDSGDMIAIELDPLNKPRWLTIEQFGNGLATLRGVPTDEDVGEFQVTLIIRDGAGAELRPQMSIAVVGGAPVSSNNSSTDTGDVQAAGGAPTDNVTVPITTTGTITGN